MVLLSLADERVISHLWQFSIFTTKNSLVLATLMAVIIFSVEKCSSVTTVVGDNKPHSFDYFFMVDEGPQNFTWLNPISFPDCAIMTNLQKMASLSSMKLKLASQTSPINTYRVYLN